eukprot:scaffold17737_cov156-Isochrysis_galbana.AAC.1
MVGRGVRVEEALDAEGTLSMSYHFYSSSRLGASPVESETQKVGARQPAFACISSPSTHRCDRKSTCG